MAEPGRCSPRNAVPLAANEPEARQLVERRPPTVSRYLDLEKAVSSPIRARLFVGAACTDWQLDALRDDAVIVSGARGDLVNQLSAGEQLLAAVDLALQLDDALD